MLASIYLFNWHDGTLHVNGVLLVILVLALVLPAVIMVLLALFDE